MGAKTTTIEMTERKKFQMQMKKRKSKFAEKIRCTQINCIIV